jgi:hypothetical protein
MRLARLLALCAPCLSLGLAPAHAQVSLSVTLQVGPDPAPQGCPVYGSVTNDTALIMGIGGCPWRIVTEGGQVVFTADCLIQELLIGPLGTIDYAWDQRDAQGNPVPPGNYVFEVLTPVGLKAEPFQVGGIDANLHVQGTAALGSDQIGFGGREIALASPLDPGAPYLVLASATAGPGVPVCGTTVPLVQDTLFFDALAQGLIPGGFGFLDAAGCSLEPKLPIPDQPELVGVELQLAFVVLDFAAACPVVRSSPALVAPIVAGV